jgi:hypothetical protein
MFELCHIFEQFLFYFYVMSLTYILVTRQQHILRFLCICFYINLCTKVG